MAIALLQAIALGTANNALVTAALTSPSSFEGTGTAHGTFQITLRAFGAASSSDAWCDQGHSAFFPRHRWLSTGPIVPNGPPPAGRPTLDKRAYQ